MAKTSARRGGHDGTGHKGGGDINPERKGVSKAAPWQSSRPRAADDAGVAESPSERQPGARRGRGQRSAPSTRQGGAAKTAVRGATAKDKETSDGA